MSLQASPHTKHQACFLKQDPNGLPAPDQPIPTFKLAGNRIPSDGHPHYLLCHTDNFTVPLLLNSACSHILRLISSCQTQHKTNSTRSSVNSASLTDPIQRILPLTPVIRPGLRQTTKTPRTPAVTKTKTKTKTTTTTTTQKLPELLVRCLPPSTPSRVPPPSTPTPVRKASLPMPNHLKRLANAASDRRSTPSPTASRPVTSITRSPSPAHIAARRAPARTFRPATMKMSSCEPGVPTD